MLSLRRQVLIPFLLAVLLLMGIAGGFAALSARTGAEAGIEARASAALRSFDGWSQRRRATLEREATRLAEQMALDGIAEGDARLVEVPFAVRRRDFVMAADARRTTVWSDRGVEWTRLRATRALRERAHRGLAGGGLAVAPDGTPVLIATVPARVPGARFGAVLVGDALDASELASIGTPLGVRLEVLDAAKRTGAAPVADGERRLGYPLEALRGRAHLDVIVPADSVTRATSTAVLTAAATGLPVAALLALLVNVLLRRSVITPLEALRSAIREVAGGNHGVHLEPGGPRELREVAEGFTRMAETLGDQHRRLQGLAAADPLTGLANHRSFHEGLDAAIERARRETSSVALVALDLDRFKQLNDEHGHPCGDDVLRAAAASLRAAVRGDDLVARVGGEEFALLLPGAGHEMAWEVAERARAAVASVRVPGVALTSSAGIACFPLDAPDAATLLERADRALYTAKREGRDQTRRYHARQGARSFSDKERAEVVDVLRRPDALVPVFQPLVDLASGRLVGYEALSRFTALPARPPDAWFAQARRCGLGHELEAAALKAALDQPGRPPGTFLSLNVSPSALASAPVQRVLPEDLSSLVLEVTEHEVVGDNQNFRRLLAELRGRGARIALDDAGSGYAGLQAVMRMELDVIKLDRSLVDGVHGDLAKVALVESFVRFARRTGAAVCAEGIESLDDLNVLADLDVPYGQGYVLARPAPPWAPVSPSVAEVLLRRSVASGGDLSARDTLPETGDRRLEALCGCMSRVSSAAELPALFRLIREELRADDLCFSRWSRDRGEVTAFGEPGSVAGAEAYALADYPATAHVLKTQESAQVLAGDPGADAAEVRLLGRGPYRSLLMVPVISLGQTVGLLELFREREEPWQRTDVNRARIICYQLGPVLETLVGSGRPAPAPGAATVTSLSERRGRTG
jgi:diguanylate cyclase (GGDEF)-like protein